MLGDRTFFSVDTCVPSGDLPDCLFVTGFDPLMLGYEKTESLFVPDGHVRDIFTRAGIIRATVPVHGEVVGWWSLKNRCLTIRLFDPSCKPLVTHAAERLWPALRQVALV